MNHKTFIFHMCNFLVTRPFTSFNNFWPSDLDLEFDLLFKNFNLGHNLWNMRDRVFIFHMCFPCDKTFHTIPYFSFLPNDLDLNFEWHSLNVAILIWLPLGELCCLLSFLYSYFTKLGITVCVLILMGFIF